MSEKFQRLQKVVSEIKELNDKIRELVCLALGHFW